MNHKKRLLILIPNLGRGGAQQVFRDQLQFYSDHYTTLGCVFNWDDSFADDRSLNIISLNIPAGNNFLSKIFFFTKRVVAVRKIKKHYKIDVCISHLEGADYVNLLSKRNEKTICWIHGSKSSDENIAGIIGAIRKRAFIPLAYKSSDVIATVSDGIKTELINKFGMPSRNVKTIYNSFNIDEIADKAVQPLASSLAGLFESTTAIITHCRLSRQKNLFTLIDIYRVLKDRLQVKLVVLGDGELRQDLLNHCTQQSLSYYSIWDQQLQFNLNYDVYFLGYERNPYPYLNKAALYIMTSSWEGFPLSLCEAMACGLPVVSSDCYTGPREIIAPDILEKQPVGEPVTAEYGVLMPLASKATVKTWATTIQTVLQNAMLRKRLIENGKKRILAFDRKTISSQWLSLLEQQTKES